MKKMTQQVKDLVMEVGKRAILDKYEEGKFFLAKERIFNINFHIIKTPVAYISYNFPDSQKPQMLERPHFDVEEWRPRRCASLSTTVLADATDAST